MKPKLLLILLIFIGTLPNPTTVVAQDSVVAGGISIVQCVFPGDWLLGIGGCSICTCLGVPGLSIIGGPSNLTHKGIAINCRSPQNHADRALCFDTFWEELLE